MRRLPHSHACTGTQGPGVRGAVGVLFTVILAVLAGSLPAQTPVLLTNLAQLTQLVEREQQVVADARFQATVFACDTNTGAIVLQDSSGAELLELDGLQSGYQPGDKIEIAGQRLFFCAGAVGVYVSTAPLLNNDGVHGAKSVSGECLLAAGRHALRLDWFNQVQSGELALECLPPRFDSSNQPSASVDANFLHAVSAQCYQGFWFMLPDFQLLQPVKAGSVSNFDINFRTRNDMVGIRFSGYVDVPQTGTYQFHLRSDDGSRLWLGDAGVPVRKIGTTTPPLAPKMEPGEPAIGNGGHRLATVEGQVRFASVSGKGMHLELYSEQRSVSVEIAGSGSLKSDRLMNEIVRVSGVTGNVLSMTQRNILGTLSVASSDQLTIVKEFSQKDVPSSIIRTVAQIHSLSSNEVAQGLPVEIRGVVTAVGSGIGDWIVIQDETRGTFVGLNSTAGRTPRVGEFWSIVGRTKPGGFAPEIAAEKATFLGPGRLPEPARPTWSQLANGSMDVQWVELQGLVTGVARDGLSLLLPEGHEMIRLPEMGEAELTSVDKALVRIRGTLFAAWDGRTHEANVGEVVMNNAAIAVEKPAPKDPFDAPEKTPRGLFRFDAKATPLQRIKVLGQVTYVDSSRLFMESDAGIEVFPSDKPNLRAGDNIEAVGYPELYDTGPQLREAVVLKTGNGVLPEAPLVSDAAVPADSFFLRRIRIEGILAGLRTEADTLTLQVQTHARVLVASVADGRSLENLRLGSRLLLTGVYVSPANNGTASVDKHFGELLVNGQADIAVISEPSWWTLPRLLMAMGVLLAVLALASVWIAVLRRQVAQRTLRLHKEIRVREQAERQHAVEAERSRIARDLHDELGSGLTEMSLLASAGLGEKNGDDQTGDRLHRIAERARSLVAGLDVIVWAIDPGRNSLQAFSDYVEFYAGDLLSASNIHCRFKIPVECRPATLAGSTRHSLLLAVKETLTNVIRHSSATEVELQISQPDNLLEIIITDNGRGFDPLAGRSGDGVRNLHQRMEALRGKCEIAPAPGKGTSVRLTVPIEENTLASNEA